MENIQKNLILYNGISNCKPSNIQYFNQINIDFTLCLPKQKPDIDQITKVWIDTCIVESEIIKTPIGTSLEGQILTGYKLLVCGDIKLKIEYIACDTTQSVHSAHTVIPFCEYIVLPTNTNPNTLINPSIIVEDIFSEQLDCRCIYNNITMMLIANIC
ncbi:MAG: DUF3794 domain-containing protein [Terrisporobacter sp.]|uniref:SPOCS domain-containing protein n=1 Tax=Terrisporobacter sp. TaxID=1965305 RepID=UPI002FC8373C